MNNKRECFLRAPGNYDVVEASDASGLDNGDMPSLTVQSQMEDADINVILRRFGVTGQMPVPPRLPTYGDFSGISDFKSAIHAIRDAEEQFALLPPEHRAKWSNDPQQFLEFCSKEENVPWLQANGYGKDGPISTPPATPVAPPPGVAPSAPGGAVPAPGGAGSTVPGR